VLTMGRDKLVDLVIAAIGIWLFLKCASLAIKLIVDLRMWIVFYIINFGFTLALITYCSNQQLQCKKMGESISDGFFDMLNDLDELRARWMMKLHTQGGG